MKTMFLAALTAFSPGVGAANAQSFSHGGQAQHAPSNFMQLAANPAR